MEKKKSEAIELQQFTSQLLAAKLQCIICHSVPLPDYAYIHRQCGKLFCKDHIEEWFKTNASKTCPFDRAKNAEILLCRGNDQFAYSTLIELELKCPISSFCSWIGQLGDLSTHTATCYYVPRPCRYFPQVGCQFKGDKAELDAHYNTAKDEHLTLFEKRLEMEIARNAQLTLTFTEKETELKSKIISITTELNEAKLQHVSVKKDCLEPRPENSIDSFTWDTSLQGREIFEFTNNDTTVAKLGDTTYSVITKAALPEKSSWKIVLDDIHYFEEPAAGFGIATRRQLGSCKGPGGYLSCDGGIGISVLNNLHRMKGNVNIQGGEAYLCELNMDERTFTISGKNTYAVANIDPGRYFIYAEFYKRSEQITIKI